MEKTWLYISTEVLGKRSVCGGCIANAKPSTVLALAWLVLLHILQRSQNLSPAVTFSGTLVVSVEQTVVIATNLESNVERFILISLSSVASVAFHTPPVAIGFHHGTNRFIDQIKVTLVDYCCRKVLCHLQEIAADVGDLQVFGLLKDAPASSRLILTSVSLPWALCIDQHVRECFDGVP